MRPERSLQEDLLQRVSRTFALTIPRLSGPLGDVVGNGYLLCRLIDVVEDELPASTAPEVHAAFFARIDAALSDLASPLAVRGEEGGELDSLSRDLESALRAEAPAGERELVKRLPDVLAITATFDDVERQSLLRCVRTMSHGMHRFTRYDTATAGLSDVASLERYCYYVAGVVGEMLTELFCHHSPAIAAHQEELAALSVRFGNGLQLTNILKDVGEDYRRGVCWLPRDAFGEDGVDLPALFEASTNGSAEARAVVAAGMERLLGLCRDYLDDAIRYIMTIPASEHGVRVFCLWSVGMAVMTLRKVHSKQDHFMGRPAKITRNGVRASLFMSDLCARNDVLLKTMHRIGTRGLPALQPDYPDAL